MMTLPPFPRIPFDSCAINVGDQALPLAGVMFGTQISVYSYTPCNTTCFHLYRFLNLLMSTYLSHMFCYYLGSFYPLPLQQCRKKHLPEVKFCLKLLSSHVFWVKMAFGVYPNMHWEEIKGDPNEGWMTIKLFAQCCWIHFPLCTCTLGRSCAGRPPLEIIGETKIKSPNKRNRNANCKSKVNGRGWMSEHLFTTLPPAGTDATVDWLQGVSLQPWWKLGEESTIQNIQRGRTCSLVRLFLLHLHNHHQSLMSNPLEDTLGNSHFINQIWTLC